MKKSFYKPGRLYFFPAFLPLIELVPWLITLVGVVTGAASFSLLGFLGTYKKPLIGLSVLCFGAVTTISMNTAFSDNIGQKGAVLINPADFPVATLYPNPKALNTITASIFQKTWALKTDHQILSAPVIQGGLLIYGSYKGSVEAVSLQGAHIWSLPLKTYATSLSSDQDGNIYVGEGLHETKLATLTSFNVTTRTVNWQRQFTGHIESHPVIDAARNHIWMSAGPGGLWSLDKDDATVHQHVSFGHIDSKPLILNNRVYIQAQENENINLTTLFAFNEEDGEIIWQLDLPGQPWGSALRHKNGKAILTTTGLGQIGVQKQTDKGWAYSISLDGTIIWQKALPGMALQPGIYLPKYDLIIHTLKSGEIIALDATKGTTKWHVRAGESFMATSTLIDLEVPMIASISNDGRFTIRDARTGRGIMNNTVGKNSSSAPIVQGDTIYVLSAYEIQAYGGLQSLVEH